MNFVVVQRDGFTIICALEVDDIGWNLCDGDVVEPFVKSGMSCCFHSCGFGVTSKCILCCTWHTSKERAFQRVGFKFCRFLSRRLDPNSAPKCLKVGEVFLFASGHSNGGFGVRLPSGNGILHLEGMVECARPEFW